MARIGIFLIVAALVAGMAGCGGGGGDGESYTLTVNSTAGGVVAVSNVTIPGTATFTYDPGTVVNLNATQDTGYYFAGWTGNVSTVGNVSSASTTITMNGDYLITAMFVRQYRLIIGGSDGGTVTSPGTGPYYTYDAGTVVNLVATPAAGYQFSRWTGNVSTVANVSSASTTITMNDYYLITAIFALEIRDWYDLDAVRNNWGGEFVLMNDLDSTTPGYAELASATANGGEGWQPIGTFSNGFHGIFDGQGHEIKDLFINRPGENYTGLFGHLAEGVIESVGVVNATVAGDYYVGSLAGHNDGTVSNCHASGSVSNTENGVGGLVGWNDGDIVGGSYAACNVTGKYQVGGLVGYNDGTVSDSCATGNVAGFGWTGGLVGGNSGGTVNNCYATGNITNGSIVGGLVGNNYASKVSNCYATGSVSGWDYAGGGLIGRSYSRSSTVTNCYATGSIAGTQYAAGLVGINEYSTVSDCYSIGSADGDIEGGLIAFNDHGTVTDSFWDTQSSGQPTSDGGMGKTAAEMKDIVTFSGATWNITAVASPSLCNLSYIWNIVDDVTYPFLSWQPV